jgi:hypothetical protein
LSGELIRSTGRWLRAVDPDVPIKVIGFRHHGTRPQAADIPEPDSQQLARVRFQLEANGLSDVVTI